MYLGREIARGVMHTTVIAKASRHIHAAADVRSLFSEDRNLMGSSIPHPKIDLEKNAKAIRWTIPV